MSTPTPSINGLVIGQAERVTRAVLERLLATEGRDFHQWVILNLLHTAGGEEDERALVTLASTRLRIAETPILDAVETLIDGGQLDRRDGRLTFTDLGAATRARIQSGIDGITERFYGDIPPEDLATAGRVLTIVTSRAEAELATAG